MKTCPPGVVCIENFTMFFIILCVLIIFYLIYNSFKGKIEINNRPTEKIIVKENNNSYGYGGYAGLGGGLNNLFGFFTKPNYGYTNLPGDVLLNPYSPPLRDERYFIPQLNYIPPGTVPINVSTNVGAVDTSYRQLGILTSSTGNGRIIPLMGRPLFVNRDKWQYYTISDQNNSIKLPLLKNGRSCTNEYGCDKLFSGDHIQVEGLNESYKITTYDSDTIKYLPFL